MSWFIGLVGRIVLFWGLWIAGMIGGVVLLDGRDVSGDDWGLLGRMALFGSAAALAFAEWSRLNRAILAMEAALKEAGRPLPRRWEMSTHGCLVFLFAAGFWALALLVFSSRLQKVDEGQAALWVWGIGTAAWTVVSLLVVSVLVGGLTRMRYRVAARGLSLPAPPVTLPWVVGVWCSMALLLSFFGLPDPRLVEALGTMVTVASASPDRGAEVELLVELGPDDDIREISGVLQAAGAVATRAVPGANALEDPALASTWVVTTPAEQTAVLALLLELDDENVAKIELNAAVSVDPLALQGPCVTGGLLQVFNDPYASGQRELGLLGMADVASRLRGRAPHRPALVAVIDTGIAGTQEDLLAIVAPRAIDDDRQGHGTAVASVIGAVADNRRGIASFNLEGRYIQVQSFPALAGLRPGADDVAEAIESALDAGAVVINLSFGAEGQAPSVVREAVARALRAGVIVVASAGNGTGPASGQWPANLPGVLVVGATDALGQGRASFSKRTDGTPLAVAAPGEDVCAATNRGTYETASGTSMAAPLVSGLLGMMKAICPELSPADAARILMDTGTPPLRSGLGPMVNAGRALEALVQGRADCRLTVTRPSWTTPTWSNPTQSPPTWEPTWEDVDTGD